MKKILFTIACLVSAMTVSAQRASSSSSSFFSTEKAEQPITIGVRAGMNIATMTGDIEGNDSRIGFNAGVSVDIPLLQSLYLQTGLYVTQKGTKSEYYDEDYDCDIEEKLNPLYLQIPILASYRYNFTDNTQLQVNFGPYLAYGISGKYEATASAGNQSYSEDYDFFGDGDDEFGGKRFEMGLQVGAGVTFNKIYVGAAYEFGLTDAVKDDGYSIKNSNFMINVGYNF